MITPIKPLHHLYLNKIQKRKKKEKRKEVCLAGIPFLFLPPSDMSKSSLLSIVV
jgi:hypothetical protein